MDVRVANKRGGKSGAESKSGAGSVILLRHAQASWPKPGDKDIDRALDDKGREEALAIANLLKKLGIRPSRIVCSTARRCRETLAPLETLWDEKPALEFDEELYLGGLPTYADMISDHTGEGTLMIIGHNPMIEDVFARMANGQEGDFLGYPTAGLAVFSRNTPNSGPGIWKLERLYQP